MDCLEFIESRGGHCVPVFEGRALHSIVDPILEAEKLVQTDIARLSRLRSVIVLGLGGGFHVDELLKTVPGHVIVIEAEKTIALALRRRTPHVFEKTTIIAGESPSKLAVSPEILDALSGSFGFFRHPASIRQRPDYYGSVTQLLTARTATQMTHLSRYNSNLSSFFSSLNLMPEEILTLPALESAMKRRGTGLDDASMIWLVLRELVK